jgi:L-xylulokinase
VLWWKDYVRMSLTGVACSDFTDAGAAGLLDLTTRSWKKNRPELPPLQESTALAGRVTPAVAHKTNLPSGTPVFTGCIDCEAAAIGSGVSEPDQLSIVAGTWSINQAFVDVPPTSTNVFLANPSSQPGRWLLLEGSPTSASHFDWLVRAIRGRSDFTKVAALAAAAPASDLLFLPRLFAEQSAFVGLGPQHDLGAMARAVMAGVAYSHRAHVEKLRAQGLRFRVARLAGGATRSPFWCQLFADVLGIRIEVPAVAEPGALGAALIAGVGAGIWPTLAEAQRATVRVDRTFEPHAPTREFHHRAYARFQQLSVLRFP